MDKFLEKYNLPKLNEEEAENLNRPITTADNETVKTKQNKTTTTTTTKTPTKLWAHEIPGQDVFTGEFLPNI